jgi:hypothetical protein
VITKRVTNPIDYRLTREEWDDVDLRISSYNPIVCSAIMLVESIGFILGGPKPYRYRGSVPSTEEQVKKIMEKRHPVDKVDQEGIEDAWEQVGESFESVMGIWPGSPTWRRMDKGLVPKSEEFIQMKKYREKKIAQAVKETIEYLNKGKGKKIEESGDESNDDNLHP